jgi:hypothetical protein
MSASVSVATASMVSSRRFVKARQIEKPPLHGEKPYVTLVDDAFDGPTLRISQRLRLLEEADTRKIRRGDALDVIHATQRRREKQFAVKPKNPLGMFATRYVVFVAGYAALAAAWCIVSAL